MKRAEAILLEREQAAAKEAEAAGGGAVKRKPLVKQAVTELLRSFGSFAQLEVRLGLCGSFFGLVWSSARCGAAVLVLT